MTQNPPGGNLSINDSTSRHYQSLIDALHDVFEDFDKNPALNEEFDTAIYALGQCPEKGIKHDFVAIHSELAMDVMPD